MALLLNQLPINVFNTHSMHRPVYPEPVINLSFAYQVMTSYNPFHYKRQLKMCTVMAWLKLIFHDDTINKENFLGFGANRLYSILHSAISSFHDCGQVPYIFSFSVSSLYTMGMMPTPLQEMAEKRQKVPSVGEFPRKNSIFSIPKWTQRSKHSNFTYHKL